MTVSLNEIVSGARKAARGAGHPWGVAAEAAMATRWACAHGLDGCGALARLLARTEGGEISARAPQTDMDVWRAEGGMVCPVLAGAVLSDFAFQLPERPIVFESVAEPILVLPFAAAAARYLETPVTVQWRDGAAVTDGEHTSVRGTPEVPDADTLTARAGGVVSKPLQQVHRAAPDARAWATLERFAVRTYAPATKHSRESGAGSGQSDND